MTEEEIIERIPDEKARNFVKYLYANTPEEIPERPEKNVWYVYHPDGAVCSDGTPYYSIMRVGTENRLMVLFCGGGVALDAYSAARPNEVAAEEGKQTFYTKNTAVIGYFYGKGGIAGAERAENPFKDWSVVIVQYASGDFHCGTNDFSYDDPEMGRGVCRHRGYQNYRAMVEKIRQYVPDPEQVMVTGFSAGGFGTALLSDDVMGMFSECKNFVCLVDSGMFSYKGWHDTAQNQWKAPEEICDRLVSDNLTLDCLLALHKKHGNKVKIAFACTYRDALLAECQNYTDGRGMIFDQEGGDRFQEVLKEFVETLCREIPDGSIYLFDRKNPEVAVGNLSDHTIIASDLAFTYSYRGHRFIDWAERTAKGETVRVGLELLGLDG